MSQSADPEDAASSADTNSGSDSLSPYPKYHPGPDQAAVPAAQSRVSDTLGTALAAPPSASPAPNASATPCAGVMCGYDNSAQIAGMTDAPSAQPDQGRFDPTPFLWIGAAAVVAAILWKTRSNWRPRAQHVTQRVLRSTREQSEAWIVSGLAFLFFDWRIFPWIVPHYDEYGEPATLYSLHRVGAFALPAAAVTLAGIYARLKRPPDSK